MRRRFRESAARNALRLLLFVLAGCGRGKPDCPDTLPPLAREGCEVYMRECRVCHGPDPSRHGPLGPPIVGSSIELLEARVLRLSYPEGYVPKQDTHQMFPALPHLAPKIPALHAYLDPRYHGGDE